MIGTGGVNLWDVLGIDFGASIHQDKEFSFSFSYFSFFIISSGLGGQKAPVSTKRVLATVCMHR